MKPALPSSNGWRRSFFPFPNTLLSARLSSQVCRHDTIKCRAFSASPARQLQGGMMTSALHMPWRYELKCQWSVRSWVIVDTNFRSFVAK
jgi:hypothetical protein